MFLMLRPTGSNAQTYFKEPGQSVDYTAYTTPDQCLAALIRMGRTIKNLDTINWDTTPPGMTWRKNPWPQPVVVMARQCSSRWSAATASTEEFRWLFRLYLAAGRTVDANAYFERALAATDSRLEGGRLGVLKTAIGAYMADYPENIQMADSLYAVIAALPPGKRGGVLFVAGNLVLRKHANELGDSNLAMRAAIRAEVAWLELTEAERGGMWYGMVQQGILENLAFIHRRERMDSLQNSTIAYVNLVQKQVTHVLGVNNASISNIGVSRPPLTADYWFPRKPQISRPTVGKISIVWPVNGDCAQGGGGIQCHSVYAGIQRLHRQFPDVEITLVTYIEGGFLSQAPPTPPEEAQLKWNWISEQLHLPVTLAVLPGAFVQLPDPDSRFISTYWELDMMNAYTDGDNDTRRRFAIERKFPVSILDTSGIVVWQGSFGVEGEMQIFDVIEALKRTT